MPDRGRGSVDLQRARPVRRRRLRRRGAFGPGQARRSCSHRRRHTRPAGGSPQAQCISLKHIRHLVLDEADRMLDMGFKPAVDRIVLKVAADRQTCSSPPRSRARWARSPRPTHATPVATSTAQRSRRRRRRAPLRAPRSRPSSVLSSASWSPKMPTARWSSSARSAAPTAWSATQGAQRHGGRHARQQVAVAAPEGASQLESGRVDTLVATDLAARGIDVPDVTHVIEYDAPEDRDAYVHRTGAPAAPGAPASA